MAVLLVISGWASCQSIKRSQSMDLTLFSSLLGEAERKKERKKERQNEKKQERRSNERKEKNKKKDRH